MPKRKTKKGRSNNTTSDTSLNSSGSSFNSSPRFTKQQKIVDMDGVLSEQLKDFITNAIQSAIGDLVKSIEDGKQHVAALETTLTARFEVMKEEVKTDIKNIHLELKDAISEVKSEVNDEFKRVDANVLDLKDSMKHLKNRLNDIEQNSRKNSIRIVGLKLPESCKEPKDVSKHVFDNVISVLLNDHTMRWRDVIEDSHTLHSDKEPIIAVRFRTRHFLQEVLSNKKKLKEGIDSVDGRIYINPSLTRENYMMMMSLIRHPEVEAAWFSGRVKFRLKENPNKTIVVRDITSMADSLVEGAKEKK